MLIFSKLSCQDKLHLCIEIYGMYPVAIGNDLKIKMEGGEDSFKFKQEVSADNSVDVELEGGNDFVRANSFVHAGNDAKFHGGDGRDTFRCINRITADNAREIKSFSTRTPCF